jgi:hypothetical protein
VISVAAYEQWHRNVSEHKVMAAKAHRVVERWVMQCVARIIDAWYEHTVEAARRRKRLARIVQRIQMRGVVLALSVWHSNVLSALQVRAEEERRNAVMQRIVKRMQHAAVAASFFRWCDNVRELRGQRNVMERVALRRRTAGMFAAFKRWQEYNKGNKAMVVRSTRVVLRWKLQVVVSCLGAWRELTAEEVRQRDLMGRIVSRMLQRSLSFAMDLWQRNMPQEAQELAKQRLDEAAREKQRMAEAEERRIEMCKRVVQRMLRHQLLMAWNMFVHSVKDTQRNHETIHKVLSRMTHRLLAGVFECYAGAVQALVAQRERVARKMARCKTLGLKRAMKAWTEYLQMSQGERAQETNSLAGQYLQDVVDSQREKAGWDAKRRVEMCKRVVARMLKKQLALAWAWFADCVQETVCVRQMMRVKQGRRQLLLQNSIERMRLKLESSALSRWSEAAYERTLLNAKRKKVAVRWMYQSAASNLFAWYEETAENKCRKSISLDSHKAKCIELSRQRVILEKLVSRISIRLIRKAWGMWVKCCLESLEWPVQYLSVGRLLLRLKRATLCKAFAEWLDVARRCHVLAKFVVRSQISCLSGAWNTWALYCEDTAEMSLEIALIG